MNGFTQRLRPQYLRSLLGKIFIDKYRCHGHKLNTLELRVESTGRIGSDNS